MDLAVIENALAVSNTGGPDQINAAQEILNQWFSTDILGDFIQILQNSQNQLVKQKLLYLFKRQIIQTLSKYELQTIIQFKSSLINIYFMLNDNDTVKELLSQSISIFNLIDVTNLEQNLSICLCEAGEDQNISRLKLQLLYHFFTEKETSKFVTEFANKHINHFLMERIEHIIHSLNLGMQNAQLIPATLSCYKFILKFAPIENIDMQLVHMLCTSFLSDANTITPAIECLISLFIKRKDTAGMFRYYSSLLISVLVHTKNPTSPSQPLITFGKIIEFILPFLRSFLNYIIIPFYCTVSTTDPEILQSMQQESNEIFSGMKEFQTGTEDFMANTIELCKISLSIPPENIDSNFWTLWDTICFCLKCEVLDSQQNRPFMTFFSDLIPYIREMIITLFPSSFDAEPSITFNARSCLTNLLSIDAEETFNFLSQMDPSPALFYTIGFLETSTGNDGRLFDLFSSTINLIDQIDEDTEEEYITSLLFASTHCITFLSQSQNREYLIKVLNFIVSALQISPKTAETAAGCLSYLTQTLIVVFVENGMELASQIIEQSESFISALDKNTISILFISCCNIISQCTADEITSAMKQLLSPLVEILNSFCVSPEENVENCMNALTILSDIIGGVNQDLKAQMSNLLVPVYKTVAQLLLGNENLLNLSTLLYNSLAALLSVVQYELAEGLIWETVESFINAPESLSVAFGFISQLRTHFPQMDQKLESIIESFVIPVLAQGDDHLDEVLQMLAQFNPNLIDMGLLENLFDHGIADMRPSVTISTTTLWQRILENRKDRTAVFRSNLTRLFDGVIQVMTDELHKQALDEIIYFFRFLMQMQMTSKIINEVEFDNFLLFRLQNFVGQQENDVFMRFIICIKATYNSPSRFGKACEDFLLVTSKLAPADSTMFPTEDPVLSRYSRRNNAAVAIRNAMKYEGKRV